MSIRKLCIINIKYGDHILIISDDLTTTRDIKLFCTFMKHNTIYQNIKQIPLKFLIKKGLK